MNIYLTFIGDKKTLPSDLVWYLNYFYILPVNSNDINAGMCAISLLCMKSCKFLHQLAKSERSSNMNRAHKIDLQKYVLYVKIFHRYTIWISVYFHTTTFLFLRQWSISSHFIVVIRSSWGLRGCSFNLISNFAYTIIAFLFLFFACFYFTSQLTLIT